MYSSSGYKIISLTLKNKYSENRPKIPTQKVRDSCQVNPKFAMKKEQISIPNESPRVEAEYQIFTHFWSLSSLKWWLTIDWASKADAKNSPNKNLDVIRINWVKDGNSSAPSWNSMDSISHNEKNNRAFTGLVMGYKAVKIDPKAAPRNNIPSITPT